MGTLRARLDALSSSPTASSTCIEVDLAMRSAQLEARLHDDGGIVLRGSARIGGGRFC